MTRRDRPRRGAALRQARSALYEFLTQPILALPRTQPFLGLKRTWLRAMGAEVGQRVVIYPGVWIMTGRELVIGDDVDLALGVLITTGGGVRIGDRTLIGYRSCILSSNHAIPEGRSPIFDAGHVNKPVVIGQDVWIGANATVLPGTRVGDGAVVAAGAVVTTDVAPFTVVGGVPARIIAERS